MNFIALIGIVKETHENGNDFSVDLKIEKPFVENNED
jgi:dihydroneopterin aldolase